MGGERRGINSYSFDLFLELRVEVEREIFVFMSKINVKYFQNNCQIT